MAFETSVRDRHPKPSAQERHDLLKQRFFQAAYQKIEEDAKAEEEAARLVPAAAAATSMVAQPLPHDAIEQFILARAELEHVIELVGQIEAQQHMGVANMPPQQLTPQRQATEKALAVRNKARHLQTAAATLAGGAASLERVVAQEDRMYGQMRELLRKWHLRSSPLGSRCPYVVDLRIPGASPLDSVTEHIELWRDEEGNVECLDEAEASTSGVATGVEAVHAVLLGRQREEESNEGLVLVKQAVALLQSSTEPEIQRFSAYLQDAFFARLQGSNVNLLDATCTWLRHTAFLKGVCRRLQGHGVPMRPVPTSKTFTSCAFQLTLPDAPGPLVLLIQGEQLLLEGLPARAQHQWTSEGRVLMSPDDLLLLLGNLRQVPWMDVNVSVEIG